MCKECNEAPKRNHALKINPLINPVSPSTGEILDRITDRMKPQAASVLPQHEQAYADIPTLTDGYARTGETPPEDSPEDWGAKFEALKRTVRNTVRLPLSASADDVKTILDRKFYLAGPMSGYFAYNFPLFNRVAAALRSAGFSVTNPAENFGGNDDLPYPVYLRRAVSQVAECDTLILLPGWEHSTGVAVELLTATSRGTDVWEAQIIFTSGVTANIDLRAVGLDEIEKAIERTLGDMARSPQPSRFEELLEQMRDLHRRKRSDYCGEDQDILYNYAKSGELAGISLFQSIFARTAEKVIRISSIMSKGGTVEVEDEDPTNTLLDIAIQSLLAIQAFDREGFFGPDVAEEAA